MSPACLKTCADQLAPHLHKDLQQITGAVQSPVMIQMSTIIPFPKKPIITELNDYRPVALTSVVMKSFERMVLAYLKASTGPTAVSLQSKQVCGWCSQHGTALFRRFSTAWYGTVRYGTVRHGSVRYGTAQFGSVAFPPQFSTAIEWAGLFTRRYNCAASTAVTSS